MLIWAATNFSYYDACIYLRIHIAIYMVPQCLVHVKTVFVDAPCIVVALSADSGANDENLCFSACDENDIM